MQSLANMTKWNVMVDWWHSCGGRGSVRRTPPPVLLWLVLGFPCTLLHACSVLRHTLWLALKRYCKNPVLKTILIKQAGCRTREGHATNKVCAAFLLAPNTVRDSGLGRSASGPEAESAESRNPTIRQKISANSAEFGRRNGGWGSGGCGPDGYNARLSLNSAGCLTHTFPSSKSLEWIQGLGWVDAVPRKHDKVKCNGGLVAQLWGQRQRTAYTSACTAVASTGLSLHFAPCM